MTKTSTLYILLMVTPLNGGPGMKSMEIFIKWYWVGPEYGADFKSTNVFEAGTYYLRVFNNDNSGNYVLAIN